MIVLGLGHQAAKDVGLEVGLDALKDGRHALEAHPGIDVLLGQRLERSVLVALVLHEHEVPVLHVPVAIASRRALLGAAAESLTLVVVQLRARSARPGGAGGPEVVGSTHAHDSLGGHVALLKPQPLGLVVILVDRRPDPLGVELQDLGGVLPRPADGLSLEVVAEAEVAEHLEERVVATGGADDVDVGSAHALLARGGPSETEVLEAQKRRLELHHSSCSQQQRRIVGDQRARRVTRTTLALEEREEAFADLSGVHLPVSPSSVGSTASTSSHVPASSSHSSVLNSAPSGVAS